MNCNYPVNALEIEQEMLDDLKNELKEEIREMLNEFRDEIKKMIDENRIERLENELKD